jgi:hypothetical protein
MAGVCAGNPGRLAAPHLNTVELGKKGRNRSNVWAYPGVNGCRNAYGHWATYLRVTCNGGGAEAAEQALFYNDAATTGRATGRRPLWPEVAGPSAARRPSSSAESSPGEPLDG